MKLRAHLALLALALILPLGAAEKVSAPKGIPPTIKEVRYGPHERNVLNVWQAKSDRPTPVLFKIHGGGWYVGDIGATEPEADWLARGISVVSIRYRMTTTDILPAPVHDAARALQFVRSKAREWNLDPKRIVCSGGSAGGCSSLWLALHDDLADPKSADPVARESTKPLGAIANVPQSTLDPKWILEHIGPEANKHKMIFQSFGAKSADEMIEHYDRYRAAIREFSPLEHVDRNDAALYLSSGDDMTVPAKNPSHGIHHPMFSVKLKERADAVGLTCYLVLGGKTEGTLSPREFVETLFGMK
ncbi:MAG: alpha/beta hydrolase [Verrucomicrobiota bacterium]